MLRKFRYSCTKLSDIHVSCLLTKVRKFNRNRAELMRGDPIWPGKTDLDQLFIIKNSLGSLTPSQTHTLLSQGIYDQVSLVAVEFPFEK